MWISKFPFNLKYPIQEGAVNGKNSLQVNDEPELYGK